MTQTQQQEQTVQTGGFIGAHMVPIMAIPVVNGFLQQPTFYVHPDLAMMVYEAAISQAQPIAEGEIQVSMFNGQLRVDTKAVAAQLDVIPVDAAPEHQFKKISVYGR